MVEAIRGNLEQPSLSRENGNVHVFEDKEGEEMLSKSDAAKKLGVSRRVINSLIKNLPDIKGKNEQGRIVKMYRFFDLRTRFNALEQLPMIDKDIKTYIDDSGEQYTTLYQLRVLTNLPKSRMSLRLSNVRKVEGRDSMGRRAILSSVSDFKRELNNKPIKYLIKDADRKENFSAHVDKKTGTYLDERGDEWAVANFFRKRLHINFNQKRLNGVRKRAGRDIHGRRVYLYNLFDVENALKLPPGKKPNGYWTIEMIEKEAMDFYIEQGRLSRKLLTKCNRQDLLGAISTYPGKFISLKYKLGIDLSSTSSPIPENVANEQLRRLLES